MASKSKGGNQFGLTALLGLVLLVGFIFWMLDPAWLHSNPSAAPAPAASSSEQAPAPAGTTSPADPAASAPAAASYALPASVPGTLPALTLSSATGMLNALNVAPEASSTAYSRDYFKHWIDADSNGCNTRAEVLIVESTTATTRSGSCTIATGSWFSPYDEQTITSAGSIDIDHMVPLKQAWLSGASDWTAQQRELYANDMGWPGSLIAVSASSNRSKSDQDPANWMPSSSGYRCTYVATWVAVKWRWNLTVDPQEKQVLSDTLKGCSPESVVAPSK